MWLTKTTMFERWYRNLPIETQAAVDARLLLIQESDYLGNTRPLGDRLFELKWHSGLRVYYTYRRNGEIVLILGGTKHDQKKTIKTAKKILKRLGA